MKGGTPPFTKQLLPIATWRSPPQAGKKVAIPEPGAIGSRVRRRQPLRSGVCAALAALAARRRAASGGSERGARFPPRGKRNGGEPTVRRRPERGECVKGGTPLSQNNYCQSELAEARASARGSCDCRAGRDWQPGSPAPIPPAPGPACGSRRTCGTPTRSVGRVGRGAHFPPREKQNGGEPTVRRRPERGECVKGGTPPFTKQLLPIGTRRSARQRARELRLPTRSVGRVGDGGKRPPDLVFLGRSASCPRPRTARPGCRGAELNRRHKDFQSSALPSELPRLRAPAISRGRGSLAQAQASCGSASSPSSSPLNPSAFRTRASTSAISGSSSSSVRRVRSRPCPICSPW